MIVIVIVAVLLVGGVVAGIVIAKGKGANEEPRLAQAAQAAPSRPAPVAKPVAEAPSGEAPVADAPKKVVKKVVKKAPSPSPASVAEADDPDLSRFGGTPGPKTPAAGPAPAPKPRYPMEADLSDLKAELGLVEPEPVVAAEPEPVPEPEPVVAAEPEPEPEPVVAAEPVREPEPVVAAEPVREPEPVVAAEPEPVTENPAFDRTLTVVAPLSADAVASMQDAEDDVEGAVVEEVEEAAVGEGASPELVVAPERTEEAPLAEIVAELIDAADPEVAEVMAKLIDASDPELVAELVGSDELEVAEVVARLVDAADPEVRSLVAELAEAPDRRQVAEVLRIVDAAYTAGDGSGELSPEIAQKLEELDLEADLELTSRPGEMAQFARLDNRDQLRVIIRVLVGLVAREDLPQSPRMPSDPASSAEHRRWPLSRARWPVPPPDGEVVVKRDPLPGRRTSKAS